MNKDKGLKELSKAFVCLPESVHLIIVGGLDVENPVEAETLSLLQQHKRIHMLGFKDDIRYVLEASNALVLPSYREGFPNVVLQAGAMGKPAVVTDINGSNEIIEDGINGWLAKPRDANALHVAMYEVLSVSNERINSMGVVARSRVVERFERSAHWERMRFFYLQEFENV